MHCSYTVSGLAAMFAAANGALVTVGNWGPNPTNLEFNINVPARPAAKPAVVFHLHGCGGNGKERARNTRYLQLGEEKGFITIFPSTRNDNNCWEVNTAKGLSRNAGGDNQGLIAMAQYAIKNHNADPWRIFVTGSSSGCMMTNVLMATYPDVISAASCYSGVPAGCLAGSPGASPATADPACASGRIIKSQDQWVKQVRDMYPGYNGGYPRMMTWHGTADNFVTYPNLAEQLKMWSGLHGVQFSRNDTGVPERGYTRMVYGDGSKVVGFSAAGVGHTVPEHEQEDLAWFGL